MKNFVSDILLLLTLAIGIVLYIPLIIIAVAFAVPLMFLLGIVLLLNPSKTAKQADERIENMNKNSTKK